MGLACCSLLPNETILYVTERPLLEHDLAAFNAKVEVLHSEKGRRPYFSILLDTWGQQVPCREIMQRSYPDRTYIIRSRVPATFRIARPAAAKEAVEIELETMRKAVEAMPPLSLDS